MQPSLIVYGEICTWVTAYIFVCFCLCMTEWSAPDRRGNLPKILCGEQRNSSGEVSPEGDPTESGGEQRNTSLCSTTRTGDKLPQFSLLKVLRGRGNNGMLTVSKCSTMPIKCLCCCHRWLRRWESVTTLPSWFLTSTTGWSNETSSTANHSVALRKRRKGSDIHKNLLRYSNVSFVYLFDK